MSESGEDRNYAWQTFGPTNTGVQATAVAMELGDPDAALVAARDVDPTRLLTLERQATHRVVVAHALAMRRRPDDAYRQLLAAERLNPEGLPHDMLARELARSPTTPQGPKAGGPPLPSHEPPVWCNGEPLPNDVAGVMPSERTSAGFEETYRAQRLPLMRFAYLLCGSTETSEDVVQSAFASAQPRWDQIEDPSSYLRRSVLNLVKDGQRRRYRLASLVSGSVTSADAIALPPEVDETWTLIQRLPWPQRAVVVLHYYEDLPLVEIAQVLQRSESTVRSDHRRALDRLRKALR